MINILNFANSVQEIIEVRFIIAAGKETDIKFADNYPEPFRNLMRSCEVVSLLPNTRKNVTFSKTDFCLATFWTTAYLANLIHKRLDNKKFIYLIQDDESLFYSAGTLSTLAKKTYLFDFFPIFSRKAVGEYFFSNIFNNNIDKEKWSSFEPPSSFFLPSWETFSKREKGKKVALFVREHEDRCNRNLALFVINRAISEGIFDKSWEFFLFGENNNFDVILGESKTFLRNFRKLPLNEYQRQLYKFDLAFNLQTTPHNSLFGVDFALSGVPSVTNIFSKEIDSSYYKSICENIIAADLDIEELLNALKKAIKISSNVKLRYNNAKKAGEGKNYSEVFKKTGEFVKNLLQA